jgi:hypothetical protein
MVRLVKFVALAVAVVAAPIALAGSAGTVPGSWSKLPAAPFAPPQGQASVWTGRELIVLGRTPLTNPASRVAEAYQPTSRSWTRLSPPADHGTVDVTGVKAVWTGRKMLAFGFSATSYTPRTDTWRELRKTLPNGIVVWTGREAIGWGGGCCGDAWSNGTAYDPTSDTFRTLPRSPLAPSQQPLGAWTGRDLVLFVSGFDPDRKAYPPRFARAAAYDPKTNSWRRLAAPPVRSWRLASSAVWDGHEILLTGAGASARGAFAYDPRTNAWRKLAPMPASRVGGAAVWTGRQLFVWGGSNLASTRTLVNGAAYDPKRDRWSTIPRAPLDARSSPVVQWAGHELIVWGGAIPQRVGPPRFPRDGAAFSPRSG